MIDLKHLEVPSDETICDLFMDQAISACISASLECGLFEALSDLHISAIDLAEAIDAHPGSVAAVANVLVAAKILKKEGDRYAATPAALTYFMKSSPLYRGYQFRDQGLWHDKILNTLQTGWSPIGDDGKSFTDMWEEGTLSQDAANRFTSMMHTNIAGPAIAVAKSGVFSDFNHIVDVGGGSGIFLSALKQNYPDKTVTLMELPQVCEAAKGIVRNYLMPNDINYFPCNMFKDTWPSNGDAYFMSNVLHDWPMNKANIILQKAFESMPSKANLFIYECLLDDSRTSPTHTVIFDLLMFANHQAQQFTFNELDQMVTDAGFTTPKQVFDFGYYTLTQTQKP